MATISAIQAREILDSRGLPTVECTLWLDSGHFVTTSVPTGTIIGKYEAVEMRDNDPDRMAGKGVLRAVENINTLIAPRLVGQDPLKQTETDQKLIDMDGTANKSHLGANSLLAVSQAILKAGAVSVGMPLYYYIQQKYQLAQTLDIPTCIYSMFNGGSHGADNLDFKDFAIIPASNINYEDSLNMGVVFYQKLDEVLVSKEAIHCVGLAGGFAPHLYTNADAFEILEETTKATPFTFAQDLFFAVDVSASHFYTDAGKYKIRDRNQAYDPKELLEYYKNLRLTHQVLYFEDPFQEDDWKSWQQLTAELGDTTNIVGDRFLVTNKQKVEKAIAEKACNAIAIKPNEVGTISETVEVAQLAKQAQWKVIISHRSGETNDDFLADLAVGIGAEYCKFGAPNRGERIAKYNRLSEIHQDLAKWQQGSQASPIT